MLLLLLLLAGCVTPEQAATIGVGVTVGSFAVIQRSPFDALYSILSGRDCSLVRLDQGKSYCRPVEPLPEAQPYCTRSLGVADCWRDPASLPGQPPQVADGPQTLTPAPGGQPHPLLAQPLIVASLTRASVHGRGDVGFGLSQHIDDRRLHRIRDRRRLIAG